LSNFTQNIDNIESSAGIRPEKLVHCHGSFATATCETCRLKVKGEDIYEEIHKGVVPKCKMCIANAHRLHLGGARGKRKRTSNGLHKPKSKPKKREEWEDSSEEEEDVAAAVAGVMKPDIVFFGEDLPNEFHERLINHDKDKVDLVIVIGTSLKVAPVSEIPGFLPPNVPQIFISRDVS